MRHFIPLFVLTLCLPVVAFAGPLDDLVGDVTGLGDAAWWAQLVALGTTLSALITAILPVGTPGDKWSKIRRVLNYIAANWGNAKNLKE